MSTISIASQSFARREAGIFNQIAMFSITGFATSMMLVVEYGVRMVPWF